MLYLDEAGLEGMYNILHLPLNPTRRANLGYVFVNFTSPEYVDECKRLIEGKSLGPCVSEKRCEVAPARLQGRASLAKHFHRASLAR